MKKHLCLILVAAVVLSDVSSADWDNGRAAADMGNFSKAYSEWLPMAENGDARAQYAIGKLYRAGEGVARDDRQAAKWIQMAAEQGHINAQYDLGIFYAHGRGVEKSAQKAKEWYEKASAGGEVEATFNLGQLYLRGDFLEKDLEKAATYFLKASRLGYTKAQINLGQMYLLGQGVRGDAVLAYVWLSLASVGTYERDMRNGLDKLRLQAFRKLSESEIRRAQQLLLDCLTETKLVCSNKANN